MQIRNWKRCVISITSIEITLVSAHPSTCEYCESRRVIKGHTILALFLFLHGHRPTATAVEAGGLDKDES